jgi:hypothetical protein
MRWMIFAFLGTLGASTTAHAQQMSPSWLVGTWTVISDEDHTPPDFADFTVDGKYINHGFNCSIRAEMSFHIYNGDIYVTAEISGKGPIAMVFRPSSDKKTMSYTSPRTHNNAVMAQVKTPCN